MNNELAPYDGLTLQQVSTLLSISEATVRNWVRLGKLIPQKGLFSHDQLQRLLGEEKSLRSRRNKKWMPGSFLYQGYIEDLKNIRTIKNLVARINSPLEDSELRLVLCEFALQLITSKSQPNLLEEYLKGSLNVGDFAPLIEELIKPCQKKTSFSILDGDNLRFLPGEDTLGFAYLSLKSIADRKRSGSYYTPLPLVKKLLTQVGEERTLLNKNILDPCCGTGNFLLAMAEGVPYENLYGHDVNLLAIQLARISFALKTGITDMNFLKEHFICQDFLTASDQRHYDVIIGNPPWGCDFSKQDLLQLKKSYRTAKSRVESYDLFIERGFSLLRDGGLLAFVLPEAIFTVAAHHPIRSLLLEEGQITFVSYLGEVFSGVQCPAVLLGAEKKSTKNKPTKIETPTLTYHITYHPKIDQDAFAFHLTKEERMCILEMEERPHCVTLENQADFALGIVTGNNRYLVRKNPEEGFEPVILGSDLSKFELSPPKHFMKFSPESYQQIAPERFFRAPEKLLYRFISSMPIFAYDEGKTLTLNSCNILIPRILGLDIKYILGILNAAPAAFYHGKHRSIKMLRSHLEKIPIPIPAPEDQKKVVSLVNQILKNPSAAKEDREALNRLTMKLYQLSPQSEKIIKTWQGTSGFCP